MARKAGRRQEALRRARDRQRATDAAEPAPSPVTPRQILMMDPRVTDGARRRLAAAVCGWCDGPVEVKARGRIPKWCSAACRQRAWEQARAATSGRGAVEIVERRIEVPVPAPPRQAEWAPVLRHLADQLAYRIHERNLDEIAAALDEALDVLRRRQAARTSK
ncbi:hypothetical protein [uncultured Jatrophihabitans sp.]|uniref:hypothetical protein n=1 Tax=uncultured Jatrophihabitans sp. TaxID=1610747 RepID=UPI0035CC53D2